MNTNRINYIYSCTAQGAKVNTVLKSLTGKKCNAGIGENAIKFYLPFTFNKANTKSINTISSFTDQGPKVNTSLTTVISLVTHGNKTEWLKCHKAIQIQIITVTIL